MANGVHVEDRRMLRNWAHGAVGALAVGLADLAIISNLSNHGVAACFGVRTTTTGHYCGKKRPSRRPGSRNQREPNPDKNIDPTNQPDPTTDPPRWFFSKPFQTKNLLQSKDVAKEKDKKR